MEKILASRVGFAGDICMTTATLAAIKKKHPESHLGYVVWQQYKPLLKWNPHIDEFPSPGRFMCSDFSHHVDFRHEDAKERLCYWGQIHAEQAGDLLDIEEMTDFRPQLFVSSTDLIENDGDKPLCIVNSWSLNGKNWRLWEHQKWIELIRNLRLMGFGVAQLGGKGDPRIENVDFQLCGKLSWLQSVSAISNSSLVIAIDSFCAHAAHAIKYLRTENSIKLLSDSTPCILLAGPVPWQNVVPENARCIPVTNYPDCEGPCGFSHAKAAGRKICQHKNSCMQSLSVAKVMVAVQKFNSKGEKENE